MTGDKRLILLERKVINLDTACAQNFRGIQGNFNQLGQVHNNLAKIVDEIGKRLVALENPDGVLPEVVDQPAAPEPAPPLKIIT